MRKGGKESENGNLEKWKDHVGRYLRKSRQVNIKLKRISTNKDKLEENKNGLEDNAVVWRREGEEEVRGGGELGEREKQNGGREWEEQRRGKSEEVIEEEKQMS